MENHSFDVTVLGGGPGGYVAAIRASQLGKRVALVEKAKLGGVCLNWGCIPTKTLLRIAERYEFIKESADWGFDLGDPSVRWERVIERSREAAEKLSRGVGFLMRKNRVAVFSGRGRFLSAHRIGVESSGTNDSNAKALELQTTHTIIATGARPAMLPAADGAPAAEPDGERIITSKEAMILPALPDSMTIIGAGAVGLEFAYFYSVFGCRVTLVEYLPRILPSGDPEISEALARSFRKRRIAIHTSSRVTSVRREDGKVVTSLEKDGEPLDLESDVALIAVGVVGNTEGLGLETVGVRTEKRFIPVDGHCATNVAGIYAIGDVRGPPALAHAASAEGLQAVSHIAGEGPEPIDCGNVPACVYCSPQVASVGMTEPQAEEAGYEIQVGRFPFSANGKAVAVGEATGFVKIIAERESGEILGAHILGPEATELIGELVLARSSELTVRDVQHSIHSHPTLSESVMEAAADCSGEATGM